MSDKIGRRASILKELKETLEHTSSTANKGASGFQTCCEISPKGQSKLHGDNVSIGPTISPFIIITFY